MSLWTPDGEHKIPPRPAEATSPPEAAQDAQPEAAQDTQPEAAQDTQPELSPEEEERVRAMAKELADARVRLLETEVATVLANHAFGVYELAAIHVTADRPKLDEARLAIDALAALLDGVQGRLGEHESSLREALHQVRLAFVQRTREAGGSTGAA